MAFAFLFPGQGSQSLHMMDGFSDIAVVRQVFDEASDILKVDFWAMLQSDDAAELNATANTQPLMLAAGYAVYRVWQQQHGTQPVVMAGHSLGEYTALVAAGVLSFADAVRLVRLRAEAMQAAVPVGVGAMAAILGLDEAAICAACKDAAQGEVVEVATFNSPEQVVIAGHQMAVERAMALCKAKGAKRVLLLPISVPSHCALMQPAAEPLAQALQSIELNAPAIKIIHNADVSSYDNQTKIKAALVRQLYQSVRWTETIQQLLAQGIHTMAECGPGKALTGLVRRIDHKATCLALADLDSLNAAGAQLV